MGILENLGDLMKQFMSGNAPEAKVHAAYDQVAQSVPQGTLEEGLTHDFNSNDTLPFEQMASGLYGESSPDQKAGLINQILETLGPTGVSQALGGAGGLSRLTELLSGGNLTPQRAEQIPPEAVQVLAQRAAKQQPSIVDSAVSFYAQHPTPLKAIGAAALAILINKISQSRR